MIQSSLRPGDTVRVKAPDEIMATLDASGCLDNMPFMPEMLQACGKEFTVYARADKTCDTATQTGGRRLLNSVHLTGNRCDGSSHGGCQAQCLNFWKEAWLVKTAGNNSQQANPTAFEEQLERAKHELTTHTVRNDRPKADGDPVVYSCQATMLPAYTTPLPWWDLRQYWRDLTTNRVGILHALKVLLIATYTKIVSIGIGYRFFVGAYDAIQRLRGKTGWPVRTGTLEKTPTQHLDLKPGEWVRIKSHEEILKTLDTRNRNRGMAFDPELVRHCGKTFRVRTRVEQIIHEGTGEMMHFKNPCIILENNWCGAEWSYCRRFCPRSIFHYWREIWLERVTEDNKPEKSQA